MQPIVDKILGRIMSIGERITELRTQKNLSQGELASALSVSRQAISKWENDQSSPDTIHLVQLADLLDTEVAYLATGVKPVYEEAPIVVNLVKKEDRVVEVEKVVEKPVIRRIVRVKYRRNPLEYLALGIVCFMLGLLLGALLF